MSNEFNTGGLNHLFNIVKQITDIGQEVASDVQSEYVDDDEVEPAFLANELNLPASVVPITVMFSDLRGFTTLVEEYAPDQVIRQLNEYFACMTRIIAEHDGILDKYIGDEIMAYFESSNPMEYSRAAYKATCAGIEMIYELEKLNNRWKKRGWPTLKNGIGINSGPVLKGRIGSMIKNETTIIGDTVNVASRLQTLTKEYHQRLLISGETQKLIQGEVPMKSLGSVPIRGKRKTVSVYAVEWEKRPSQRNSFSPGLKFNLPQSL